MIKQYPFPDKTSDQVTVFRITNAKGEFVDILDYGAAVYKLCVKNKNGGLTDVVLGYNSAEGYNNRTTFYGALIGRVTNRISGASFSFGGKTYPLSDTGGGVSLHGGDIGFNKKIFALIEDECSGNSITLGLVSEDGDQQALYIHEIQGKEQGRYR